MSQEESEAERALREVEDGLSRLFRPAFDELALAIRQLCGACHALNKCREWPDDALRELASPCEDRRTKGRMYALARSKKNVERLKREGRCR